MHTRTLLLFGSAFLLAGSLQAQFQRVVLQGAGTPQSFTDLTAAVAAAQPNDKLYLSGGTFNSPGGLTISMPLHFIGAGIQPDSTAVTGTTTINTPAGQDIRFTTGASGSTFTGIRFDPGAYLQYGTSEADDDPTGMVFQRCEFQSRHYLAIAGAGASSSTLFDECIFHSYLWGYEGVSATFTRSIFDSGSTAIVNFDSGGLLVSHCVFLGQTQFDGNANMVVENSIFTSTNGPLYQCNNATVTNSLFTSNPIAADPNLISIANQLGVPAASIFVNETDGYYQFTDDLHLAAGSGGIGAADDGTDIGLYGSSSPYKPGAVPFNPHFSSATIAPATNPNGDLPVNIRAAAQPN